MKPRKTGWMEVGKEVRTWKDKNRGRKEGDTTREEKIYEGGRKEVKRGKTR